MAPTDLKIVVTFILLWFITHMAAYPETHFAKWGERKFGTYRSFLITLAFTFLIPAILVIIHSMWTR